MEENKTKQHVIISKKGISADVFDIEEVFNRVKNDKVINTSSEILFNRLRLAVKNKEIEPFNVTVIDLDGKESSASITETGFISLLQK